MPNRCRSAAIARLSALKPQSFFVLGLALLSTSTAAECPSTEEQRWISGRPYDQGARVHHEGQWYQARERQAGHEPGSSFSWKAVDAPDCDLSEPMAAPLTDETQVPKSNSHDTGAAETKGDIKTQPLPQSEPGSSSEVSEIACESIGEYSFGEAYSPGALVRHQGLVYRATRPSTGDMPGLQMPPVWARESMVCAER
ncbi:hypothetical protein [Allohahella sp. A8]|uniref:hypothetical protein n=1 Tax=Allohahella sp. A8 TaxID=3141461 RepID=UPI003A7FF85F